MNRKKSKLQKTGITSALIGFLSRKLKAKAVTWFNGNLKIGRLTVNQVFLAVNGLALRRLFNQVPAKLFLEAFF